MTTQTLIAKALTSGAAGACALTLLHESARQVLPHAPRVDVIGRRAVASPLRWMGYQPPAGRRLYLAALPGEVLSNSLYYSAVGGSSPKYRWRVAALLGLAGGLGAVVLPPLLGLGRQPVQRTWSTRVMTVAWYLTGALAAAGAAALWDRRTARI